MAVEVQTVSSVQLISLPHISPSHTFSPLPLLPLTEPVSLLFPPPFSLSSLIFTILPLLLPVSPISPFTIFHNHKYPTVLYISFLLCNSLIHRSMEQKAAMVHLIRQSIGELRDTATTSGSSSPLPLHTSSPLAHPHNSHLSSYSPSHRHPLLPPSHSSPRHTRPRSNSQPHLQNLTPSPHPSPLAHSHHLPSLTDLTKHGYN